MTSAEIATMATGALVAAGFVYKYAKSKYGREVQNITDAVTAANRERTAALEALNEIKTLFECGKAAAADGKITPDEMEKIYSEAMEVINSPVVTKLLRTDRG